MPCNRTIGGGCRGLRIIRVRQSSHERPQLGNGDACVDCPDFSICSRRGRGGGRCDGIPAVPSRFLYASAYAGPNTFPASIYGFAVSTGGALSPVPGSPAPTSDGSGPIAITRDSKVLYTTTFDGCWLSRSMQMAR